MQDPCPGPRAFDLGADSTGAAPRLGLLPPPAVAILAEEPSGHETMVSRRVLALVLVCLLPSAAGAQADERDEARAHVEFGISVARAELWQEAIYRWERASEIDPSYAAAWNNLGIAYERDGQFDRALEAYETALDLEPDNLMIQQNYDLFREIYDRLDEDDR